MTSKHGIRSNISDMKRMFKSDLEKCTNISIIQCRRICIGTIEVEIRITNDEIDKIEHIVCSFEGEKLVRAQITNEFDTRKYHFELDMLIWSRDSNCLYLINPGKKSTTYNLDNQLAN